MPPQSLYRAMHLPGPPTCSFCGADDAQAIVTGARAFICAECAHDATSDGGPQRRACALCGAAFGARHGFLWRSTRRPGLHRNGLAACTVCLHAARAIFATAAAPPG